MITISLCMIVKNEEEVLERCLTSVKDLVEEIIIVDTGSTDKTKEIAHKFTNKIYDFAWIDDFSAARNFSFSKATQEYQLWMDADDVILEEDILKIKNLKHSLSPSIDLVTFKYHTHFDQDGNPLLTSTRERLFKRSKNYQWNDPIHEYVSLTGNLQKEEDIYITHKKAHTSSNRNINIYEAQLKKGNALSPRGLYYYARELKDHSRYIEALYYFNLFLESQKGWVEDCIGACFTMNECYKHLNQRDKGLKSLYESFHYAAPRAEVCCEIGYYYKNLQKLDDAIEWFTLATNLEIPKTMGFLLNDYWGYIPNIELCVCYSLQNKIQQAIEHNEVAALLKPNSSAVLHNRNYLNLKKV